MVRVAVCFLLICGLFALVSAARAEEPFQATIPLRNGQLLVVAESDLEPRSVGSYSYANNRLVLHYEESIGCATGMSCTDAGESRWEWPEPASERSNDGRGD
jgi:hypothetical protein